MGLERRRNKGHNAFAMGPKKTHLALLVALLAFFFVSMASAKRVTVRGKTRIDLRAHRTAGRTVIEGELKDDGDRALGGERVALDVQMRSAGNTAIPPELFHSCSQRAVDAIERSPSIFLHTDEHGRFCVAIAVQTGTLFARTTFAGEPLEDASTAELEFDVHRRGLSLTFAPLPRVVRLDATDFALSVIAQSEDDGIMHAEPDLSVRLENEKGERLADAITDGRGRASFKVPMARLGTPGPGEIRAIFEGNAELNRSVATHPVDRKVPVQLTLVGTQDGSVAEDGITLHVKASAPPHGVPAGTVEARIADTVIGTGVVSNGDATVVVVFHVDEAREQTVTLHYQPTDPYFLDGEPLKIQIAAKPPSPLRAAPMVILFGLVLAFMVLGRRPVRPDAPKAEGIATEGEPIVRVGLVTEGEPIVRGSLFDVHSGLPIAGARVLVERAQFPTLGETAPLPGVVAVHSRAAVVVEGRSDEEGRFHLVSSTPFAPGDRLVAEGRLHRRVERPLPGPGEYRVALASRRRALLDGLVAWAKGAGGVRGADPTPRDVRAQRRDVERWTRAVERAAYTGTLVDENEEEQALQHMPPK